MDVEPELEPFYYVTFILGSCVGCVRCHREPEYESSHPRFTDKNYLDQAREMHRSGWKIVGNLDVLCPICAAEGITNQ
jgi:hypothetical protein